MMSFKDISFSLIKKKAAALATRETATIFITL